MNETEKKTERKKKRIKQKNVDIQQVHAERGISYLQFLAVHGDKKIFFFFKKFFLLFYTTSRHLRESFIA